MKLPKVDVLAIVTMLAGVSGTSALSAFGDSIDALMPGYGRKAVAVVSIASFGAGLILRTKTSNTNAASCVTCSTEAPPPA